MTHLLNRATLALGFFAAANVWAKGESPIAAARCGDATHCAVAALSKAEMQSVIEFLSSDSLQGRAPGSPGGRLAEEYVKSLFQFLGLEPALPGGYMQEVPLRGFTLDRVEATLNDVKLEPSVDCMFTYTGAQPSFSETLAAVFVGFGITAERWSWDDYKGADLRGKLVIARINDPGVFDPEIFEGPALTHYGRWTYHVEEAARRGARAILLIHSNETANFGWNVVQSTFAGESLYLPSQLQSGLIYQGWITEESFRKVLQSSAFRLDDLYASSLTREFRPVDLGFELTISGKAHVRALTVNNVVAAIPGRVPQRIVLSAHIDHLGMLTERTDDPIFNGALDNASAVAAMVMVAKILKERQRDLYYGVTLLACQAEEAGLLGSRYFVENADRRNIVANINLESTPVWEKAKSIMAIGAKYSTFQDLLGDVAAKEGWGVSEFSLADRGYFFRSDQFSFATWGIPAIWISAGEDDESGMSKYTRFWSTDYHTVRDQFDRSWPLEGLRQTILASVLLTQKLSQQRSPPRWRSQPDFPMQESPVGNVVERGGEATKARETRASSRARP